VLETRLAPDLLRNLIPIVLGGLCTKHQFLEAQQFFASCDTILYQQALAGALEQIDCRATWVQNSDSDLRRWLGEHHYI
jgi:cytochrome c-type biogenesis protein CcmE